MEVMAESLVRIKVKLDKFKTNKIGMMKIRSFH